jgi:cephalosporin hydroxylase
MGFDCNSYEGVLCQQAKGFEEIFPAFLKRIKPERIIEIGTGSGGFTMFLQDSLDRFGSFANIWSYDINIPRDYEKIEDRGVRLCQCDVFKDDQIELMESLISSEGTTLLLCDGGNKKGEFNLFSKSLKVGDIIMAHDYVDTKDNFLKNYKNKIWDWREIGDEDIAEACKENNLKEYDKKIFDTIVWVCRVRV